MLKKNCAPSPRNFRVPRFVGAFRAQFQLETFFSCLRHTIFSKSKQKTANFKKCRNQYSAPFLPEGTNFLGVERPLIVFQNFSSHCNHQLRVAHTKYLIYIIIVYLSLYVEHILLALWKYIRMLRVARTSIMDESCYWNENLWIYNLIQPTSKPWGKLGKELWEGSREFYSPGSPNSWRPWPREWRWQGPLPSVSCTMWLRCCLFLTSLKDKLTPASASLFFKAASAMRGWHIPRGCW